MPVSSRTSKRRHRSARALLATACALGVLTGCSGGSTPEQPQETPAADAIPLGDYDMSDLTLARGEFCERISADAIDAVLGADPAETATWEPGRRLPGTRDISNEFGCSFSTPSVTARAWVFAPPITRSRATDFAGEVVGAKCEELGGAAPVGAPGVAQRCGRPNSSGATLTGYYGLVGDAWIGCEVSRGPSSSTSSDGPSESARVDEWCVAVLDALRTA